MASNGSRKTSDFDTMDTPYQVQPPPGSAEGPIDYGAATSNARRGNYNDPLGVLPVDATKGKNIGPGEGEG